MQDELGNVLREWKLLDLAQELVQTRRELRALQARYAELADAHLEACVTLEQIEGVLNRHT